MAETNPDPEQIEQDLAQTRARIDHRLSDLEERLSPAQLLNQGLQRLSGADGADFTRDMLARARANPLPVLMTGMGLAWWFLSEKSGKPSRTSRFGPGEVQPLGGSTRASSSGKSADSMTASGNTILALGALGAAVGAILAMTVPMTSYEERALGGAAIG